MVHYRVAVASIMVALGITNTVLASEAARSGEDPADTPAAPMLGEKAGHGEDLVEPYTRGNREKRACDMDELDRMHNRVMEVRLNHLERFKEHQEEIVNHAQNWVKIRNRIKQCYQQKDEFFTFVDRYTRRSAQNLRNEPRGKKTKLHKRIAYLEVQARKVNEQQVRFSAVFKSLAEEILNLNDDDPRYFSTISEILQKHPFLDLVDQQNQEIKSITLGFFPVDKPAKLRNRNGRAVKEARLSDALEAGHPVCSGFSDTEDY